LPARIGRGVRLEGYLTTRNALVLQLLVRGKLERFDGSAAGWVAAWTRAAEVAAPARFAAAVKTCSEHARWAQVPLRQPEAIAQLDEQMPLLLGGLTFLGGHGSGDLMAGSIVDLRRTQAGIALTSARDGSLQLAVPAGQLLSAEASSPGKPDGSFVATLGHGFFGDVTELQTAEWLNARYGKVHTVVRIQAATCELFLTTSSYLPEAAQVALSAVRAMVPGSTAPAPAPASASLLDGLSVAPQPMPAAVPAATKAGSGLVTEAGPNDDMVSQLERLARLRESGAITQFEFQAAKDKLLR
jgi:hypothetical protein